MKPLSIRCLYLISAIQSWAFGVILYQISYVQIPKRIVWWFDLLVCSTNLHMRSDTRDTFNDLQLSNKLLQLDLKGFSQTSPDIRFPLSACFQGPSGEQKPGPFPKGQVFLSDAFVPRKKRKWNCCLLPDVESRANWSFMDIFCSGLLHINMHRQLLNYQKLRLEVHHPPWCAEQNEMVGHQILGGVSFLNDLLGLNLLQCNVLWLLVMLTAFGGNYVGSLPIR